MSKLLIAQIALTVISVFSLLAIGVQIFGFGHINPAVLLPWAYVAVICQFGALMCLIIRVCEMIRERKQNKQE